MIDAGPLTQEDADEYRIVLDDDSVNWNGAIKADGAIAGSVALTMTNHDALEMAASLLIGAVFLASDSHDRRRDWEMLLAQRIIAAREREGTP